MGTTNILLFIQGLGGTEVVLIVFAILLLFGAKRIPELAKGLGRGIREFKDAASEVKHNVENSADKREPLERTDSEARPKV
ncbi:MAG TPA: twin-arginine translocase TatA/TatE family subunit [Pontibacter sp.]